MSRVPRDMSLDLHDVGLGAIEVGRQISHARVPSWAEWAEKVERQAKALQVMAKELREEANKEAGHAPE